MTQRERDIFIALIDAGLDESAVLSFVEGLSGPAGEAAGIVEALANDAHLAEMVWQMRADREAIGCDAQATPVPAATLAMVSAVLDEEISNEIDAHDLRNIEELGIGSADIAPPAHKPIKVRRLRRHTMRLPRRAPRIIGSLAAAAVLVLVVSLALINIDFGPGTLSQRGPVAASNTDLPTQHRTPVQLADAQPTDTPEGDRLLPEQPRTYRPKQQPVVVASAGEALNLAKEGRLIVRLTSFHESTTNTLTMQLATGNQLMRFAVVEGKASTDAKEVLLGALPKLNDPVMASAVDSHAGPRTGPRLVATRHNEGAYMLRVEPTKRAFSMLIAKLSSYEGLTVELIGAPNPITTPGSAADLSGLAGSPTTWKPKITVPIVVESIQ